VAHSQNPEPVFHRLTVEDGLSNGDVKRVFQDSQGFIWVCTEDGLNLFDGYTFKYYKHNSADSGSISSNNVLSILEDKSGRIWVGTHNGLNLFEKSSQKFTRYFFDAKNSESLANNRVPDLCLDQNNQLWIATDNGLCRYNLKTNDFSRYNITEDLSGNIKSNTISTLAIDKNGIIWMSEYFKGLTRLDPITGIIKNYPVSPEKGPIKNIVTSICQNPNGNLWLGLLSGEILDFNPLTENAESLSDRYFNSSGNNSINGIIQSGDLLWSLRGPSLVCINLKENNFAVYTNNSTNPKSFPKGSTQSISQAKDGNIWVGVEGIVTFNPQSEKFANFYYEIPRETNVIKQNFITNFYLDQGKILYMGTFLDGFLKFEMESGKYTRISSPDVFANSVIPSFFKRTDGNLWIATSKGLVQFDPRTNKILRHYIHDERNPKSLYHDAIELVYEDKKNSVWVATQESLDVLDTETNSFSHYTRENLRGLSHYKVTSILEDKDGNIWVGTYFGLNKIDHETNKITQYLPVSDKQNEISDPYVNTNGIYQDKAGFIWVCTKNGLNRFDPQTNSFITYYQSDGLLSDNVYQIQEDDAGNLWVTSTLGMSKINPSKKTFRNYTSVDGFDISIAAFYKDNSGCFYAGGRHENYYMFHPDSIHDNLIAPEVYLTDFLLFNKPVSISADKKLSPLQQHISTTKELVLTYKQSEFAFEFTALNYYLPEKNRFAYKMEGFNEDWISTSSKRRIASYTNLDAGDYIFRVKASNNDGIWNETGTSIKIKILPPPWKTGLAYFFYTLFLITSLYFARAVALRQLNLKNSLQIEHLEREKEQEFHQIKTKFFINISHEFRTPLTLISGPINKLISSASENKTGKDVLKYYLLIERNVNRLSELTNQLLDFRKIETGKMKVDVYQGDLVPFLKSISERFITFAEIKKISLAFTSELKSYDAWFDADKLDKIITNLLSNALKFTPENGKVSIRLEPNPNNSENVLIKVKDSGIGISEEHHETIFDRFYQVENSNQSLFEGTGIGLALSKDLVKLLNGDITLESTVGKGSTFIVDIPSDLRSIAGRQITDENYKTLSDEPSADRRYTPSNQDETPVAGTSETEKEKPGVSAIKPNVLIIEDNKDLRFYIGDTISGLCNIEYAENGALGLEKAFDIMPDIIISDVRMPEKDGIEVVQALKSDQRTSHIPVILLTALSSLESKLIGLEAGADDYITKPFNSDILQIKVKNIISSIRNTRLFHLNGISNKMDPGKKGTVLQPKDIIVSGLDDKFLSNALEIVEQNISDPEFNVEKFSAAIGMEASTLYKKLMALIDMPPGEFIRDIRMKRSAQLLRQNKIPVSEVAYMVGFDSPNYFSKVFRKYYNVSPTDFILLKSDDES
jgi:signal transduction histidine kinase/ligand-binding sensor domain-containing protein/DNA-binding response OmpR family regulator